MEGSKAVEHSTTNILTALEGPHFDGHLGTVHRRALFNNTQLAQKLSAQQIAQK
jgi:hypothetical protein